MSSAPPLRTSRPSRCPRQYEVEVTPGPAFIEASCRALSTAVETVTAVVRTSVQHAVGGYRKELPHAGDQEMWLRFASVSAIGRVKAPQGFYRRHADEHVERILRRSRSPGLRPDPGGVRVLLRRVRCSGGRPGAARRSGSPGAGDPGVLPGERGVQRRRPEAVRGPAGGSRGPLARSPAPPRVAAAPTQAGRRRSALVVPPLRLRRRRAARCHSTSPVNGPVRP